MHAPTYSPASGIDTYDAVSMSGPPPAFPETCRLGDDLAFIVQPAMPWVTELNAPQLPVDVAAWLTQPVRLQALPAEGFGARDLKQNSLLLVPAGTPTRWLSAGGMPEVIHLHVSPAFRERWCDDLGQRDRALSPAWNQPLHQAGASLRRLRSALGERAGFSRLVMQIAALEAAHACLAVQFRSVARAASQSMTPGRLRRVRAYVEENLADDVCLEDMAACVGLSPAHFSRAFRAEMGVSPYAWVVQARVERVKEALLNSRKPLAEIALQCGFASQSHMTETFRRATGLPPARWRRERAG